ncbi:MAG: hypothetical protein Q9226_006981 [Calogaya cf. arnoldii]
MPSQGLFLPRPLPIPAKQKARDPDHKNSFVGYREQPQAKDWNGAFIPSNLFQVNKLFATEAYSIFLKDVYLVVNISRTATQFLTIIIPKVTDFRSHERYLHIHHFQRMRNFHIDLSRDTWWGDAERESTIYPQNLDLAPCHLVLKERLRTICDLLTSNTNIQRLSIKLPCLCNCERVVSVECGKAQMLEVLAPLKRLRVAESVAFEINHDVELCANVKCDQVQCDDLVGTLVADVGKLTGEKLSEQEKIWKDIKMMLRGKTEPGIPSLSIFWHYLNSDPVDLVILRSLAYFVEGFTRSRDRDELENIRGTKRRLSAIDR